MKAKRLQFNAIDWTLLAAIVGLSAFLISEAFSPIVFMWRNRPRPGVQVCQRFVSTQDKSQTAQDAIDYLLYLPENYSSNTQWPLVVFLHGAGERGNDLELVKKHGPPREVEQELTPELAPWIRSRFVLVSPQCPADSSWRPENVITLIEHICGKYAVDQSRIYLTGFSMGGFGTWATVCHDSNRFAAIVPLSGGGEVGQAGQLKDMPIWAFHGANDTTVPMNSQENMVEAVKKFGGNVQFTVYPDEGHDICQITYQNPKLYEWLLAQHRN
jgi:predicted peptidase